MAQVHEHTPENPNLDEHPSQDYRTTLIVITAAIVAAVLLGVFFA